MRSRRIWRAAVGGAAAAAIAAAACGGGETRRAESARTPSPEPTAATPSPAPQPLTGVAGELAELQAKANSGTYRVRYRSAAQGQKLTSTTYRKGALLRQETQIEGSEDIGATFVRPEGTFQCARKSGAWECKKASVPYPNLPTDPAELVTQIKSRFGETINVSERRIAGADTKCYASTVSRPSEASPLPSGAPTAIDVVACYTPDGIPLFNKAGDVELEAVSFSRDVGGSLLELPAPVKE